MMRPDRLARRQDTVELRFGRGRAVSRFFDLQLLTLAVSIVLCIGVFALDAFGAPGAACLIFLPHW